MVVVRVAVAAASVIAAAAAAVAVIAARPLALVSTSARWAAAEIVAAVGATAGIAIVTAVTGIVVIATVTAAVARATDLSSLPRGPSGGGPRPSSQPAAIGALRRRSSGIVRYNSFSVWRPPDPAKALTLACTNFPKFDGPNTLISWSKESMLLPTCPV